MYFPILLHVFEHEQTVSHPVICVLNHTGLLLAEFCSLVRVLIIHTYISSAPELYRRLIHRVYSFLSLFFFREISS